MLYLSVPVLIFILFWTAPQTDGTRSFLRRPLPNATAIYAEIVFMTPAFKQINYSIKIYLRREMSVTRPRCWTITLIFKVGSNSHTLLQAPLRPAVDPWTDHVEFVMARVVLGHFCPSILCLPLSGSFHTFPILCFTHIPSTPHIVLAIDIIAKKSLLFVLCMFLCGVELQALA